MIATEMPLEERLKKWASDCDRTNYGCQFHKMLTGAAAELARLTAITAEQAARIAEFEVERDAAVSDINTILRNCECEARHHYCARGYEVDGCDSDDCSDAVWRGPRREGEQG